MAKVPCCKFYLYFFFIWISNVTYNMSYVIDTIKRALFKIPVSVALATEVLWWPDQWCISWPAGICRETLRYIIESMTEYFCLYISEEKKCQRAKKDFQHKRQFYLASCKRTPIMRCYNALWKINFFFKVR